MIGMISFFFILHFIFFWTFLNFDIPNKRIAVNIKCITSIQTCCDTGSTHFQLQDPFWFPASWLISLWWECWLFICSTLNVASSLLESFATQRVSIPTPSFHSPQILNGSLFCIYLTAILQFCHFYLLRFLLLYWFYFLLSDRFDVKYSLNMRYFDGKSRETRTRELNDNVTSWFDVKGELHAESFEKMITDALQLLVKGSKAQWVSVDLRADGVCSASRISWVTARLVDFVCFLIII